jgi:hypothetical protein
MSTPAQQPSEQAQSTTNNPLTARQQNTAMLADEDPLLISQSLTYVTDDGSVLHSFQSAQMTTGTHGIGRSGRNCT